MFDRSVRQLIDRWLDRPAGLIAAARIPANPVTVFGFVLEMLGCVAIAFQQPFIGLGFIHANRLADGLDGMVARRTGSSDVGGFLDFVLDILLYGGVPFSFALVNPAQLLPDWFRCRAVKFGWTHHRFPSDRPNSAGSFISTRNRYCLNI